MYLGKTRKRLESMSAPDELLALVRHAGPVTINGREVPNIPALWDRLETEVDRLAENVQGCVVHGDLCLSNILYDLRSRICKLLDPRGSFGAAGIYGDPRYDVAKLYHSIYGLYDFITNDLFHVSIDGTRRRLGHSLAAAASADSRAVRKGVLRRVRSPRDSADHGPAVRQHAGLALRRAAPANGDVRPGAGTVWRAVFAGLRRPASVELDACEFASIWMA